MINALSDTSVAHYNISEQELRIYSLKYPEWELIETVPIEDNNIKLTNTLKQCFTCGSYGQETICEYCENIRREI